MSSTSRLQMTLQREFDVHAVRVERVARNFMSGNFVTGSVAEYTWVKYVNVISFSLLSTLTLQ